MNPVRRFDGIVAPLLRPNIDTDTIIPSREMKRVSKRGLGDALFASWRYREPDARNPNAEFVLNQAPFNEASVLATGPNFGCGSSREHAVWALKEFGIRAILAPSFGAIFERNCFNNGLLPIVLEAASIDRIIDTTSDHPAQQTITVDLEQQSLILAGGQSLTFSVPEVQREMLLNGWDPIDRTLQLSGDIDNFLNRDRRERPWVYDL